MTYFNKIGVYASDSPSRDSFGRWRTASPFTIFDHKQTSDSGSLFWSDKKVNGATIEYKLNQSTTQLNVTTSSGSRAIRQTYQRFNYQPAKSQLVIFTANFNGGVPGIIKRAGTYCQSYNGGDGLFFEFSGSDFYLTRRSRTTGQAIDYKVSQSDWNLDKLDGTGKSGLSLDFTKSQIFVIDYEWLGVGRVRFGFVISGSYVYGHELDNANAFSGVYMTTPNHPIRFEVDNVAGSTVTGSLNHFCTAVMSEGGVDPNGTLVAIDRGGSPQTVSINTTGSLIAFRLKSTHLGSHVDIDNFSILPSADTNTRFAIHINPTASSGAWTNWIGIPKTSIEYSLSSVNLQGGSGHKLTSGYFTPGDKSPVNFMSPVKTLIRPGADANDIPDIFVLSVTPLEGTTTNYYASINLIDVE